MTKKKNQFIYDTRLKGGAEFFVDALDGEAHDVEVATVKGGDSDVADPLLDAIGTCFVEGLVSVYVITDLVVGEGLEGYVGLDAEGTLAFTGHEADASDDLVGTATEQVEHAKGIIGIDGFAQHLVVTDDYRVGSDDQIIGCHELLISGCFLTGDILCYLCHWKVCRIAFTDIW